MNIDEDRFDRQKRLPQWNQKAIEEQKVLMIGAGALGNEVLKLLLQLGVRNVRIVDFDTIIKANLNRCVFFTEKDAEGNAFKSHVLAREAKKLYPQAEVTADTRSVEVLEENIWKGHTIVMGCLDNLGARLHTNSHAYGNTPYIDGGTIGFLGKVQTVRAPSSCVECSLSKRDYRQLWERYSCVGETLDIIDPKAPALPTTTAIIAAIQVNELVKIAHGLPCLEGRYLHYDGLKQETKLFEVAKRKDCPVHPEEI
ncbi:ThiF family adenylyltransferase [Candidatus Micrarchaeota archaeon]|nr:ThiF family adenylyltransferase [Candidatus Micrarchaeota archaeon]